MVEALEQRLVCAVAAPSDSRLVWLDQPLNFVAGHQVPAVRVAVEDSSGDVLRNVKGQVQFNLLGTSGAVNVVRQARVARGVATLPRLRITKADSYQLQASVRGLPGITSNSFMVRA